MKPSLGRIVIYKAHDGIEYASLIVKCESNKEDTPVNLMVFGKLKYDGNTTIEDVIQGNGSGQWHEPRRV